jgi:hypothetical protein
MCLVSCLVLIRRDKGSRRDVLLSLKDVLIVSRFITEKAETFYPQTIQIHDAKDAFGSALSDLVGIIQMDSNAADIVARADRLSECVSYLTEILNTSQEVCPYIING